MNMILVVKVVRDKRKQYWGKFWDNVDYKLLNKIRRRKKKPSVWDLK